MRDDDLLLAQPGLEFGSGVVGVCDVCGKRQAVIILEKERFKLCVIDFLNKAWVGSKAAPGAPLPPYRSERVWFDTAANPSGRAPAILLTPTKAVKHPAVLVTPEVYGLTTSVLDAAIRCAREGFQVLVPDVGKTSAIGPRDHMTLRLGSRAGGVALEAPRVRRMTELYHDALAHLRGMEMVDPEKAAVVGLSYGGSLAIALGARDQRLKAIVLAYPMPIRPADFAKLLTAPVLWVGGSADPPAVRCREQLAAVLPADRLLVAEYPGARHHFLARDLGAYDVGVAEAAWGRVAAFLKERLLPPPPKPPAPPTRPAASPTPAAAPS